MEQSNAQARFNMVEQQVRPWDVLDRRVLEVMSEMPRERFVPDAYRGLAYADIEVPIGEGQAMMPPRLVGRMLQALNPQPGGKALEVGTGTGYFTACLAALTGTVVSLELDAALLEQARTNLETVGVRAELRQGDALAGAPEGGPFDTIAVTGSVPEEDAVNGLLDALADGGRLFVVVGEAPMMEAVLITRVGRAELTRLRDRSCAT
jgi:protein-L-isoaspartate(D-aspartate) O-methyltransferase